MALGIQPEIYITEEELEMEGNVPALKRVIQNLIKNGLDHGRNKIRIRLERRQESAVLSLKIWWMERKK